MNVHPFKYHLLNTVLLTKRNVLLIVYKRINDLLNLILTKFFSAEDDYFFIIIYLKIGIAKNVKSKSINVIELD